MRKLPKILCLCSVLFLAAWAMTNYLIPLTLNYRITVEIETPEGIKSGSAVRQVKAIRRLALNPDVPDFGFYVAGEAVVIDLGERGVLFALIDSHSYKEMFSAFIPSIEDGVNKYGRFKTPADCMKYYRDLKAGTKAELKTNHPKMVTFVDMNDSKSVRLIRGGRFNLKTQKHDSFDDFEELFGQGVRFKRITVEMTDDPVTKVGILETLPKFDDEFWKWLKTLKYGDPIRISGANFSKGRN